MKNELTSWKKTLKCMFSLLLSAVLLISPFFQIITFAYDQQTSRSVIYHDEDTAGNCKNAAVCSECNELNDFYRPMECLMCNIDISASILITLSPEQIFCQYCINDVMLSLE